MKLVRSAFTKDDHFYDRTATKLPRKVDLRPTCSPVEQQKQLSSCTANATAAAIEYLERRDAKLQRRTSRLFIYYNARAIDRDQHVDSGTSLRSTLHGLLDHGACSEDAWPYLEAKENVKPPADAYEQGARHKLEQSWRVHVNPDSMRGVLADGHPIIFAIELYKSFDGGGDHGHVKTPVKGKDKWDGDHAMACVGYDDESREFIVRNSWGKSWGDDGYAFLGYDYLGSEAFCYEAWAVTKMRAI
jgi:C1A family cysteine protease